jgi:single-stranded DNA-binding protein
MVVGKVYNSSYKTTKSGTGYITFSLASYDDTFENGSWTKKSNYFRCKIFGKRADAVQQYFKDKVVISASLRYETNKVGDKYFNDFIVNSFDFVNAENKKSANFSIDDGGVEDEDMDIAVSDDFDDDDGMIF